MELLLIQDVPLIGKQFDIVFVGEQLALSILLPQQKALVATPGVRKRYAEAIRKRALERDTTPTR